MCTGKRESSCVRCEAVEGRRKNKIRVHGSLFMVPGNKNGKTGVRVLNSAFPPAFLFHFDIRERVGIIRYTINPEKEAR